MSARRSQTDQAREARLRHYTARVNDASSNQFLPPSNRRSVNPYGREVQAELDDQLASNLHARGSGNVNYDEIDRLMAEQLQGHGPVDYEASDRALAERMEREHDRSLAEHLEAESSRGQERVHYDYGYDDEYEYAEEVEEDDYEDDEDDEDDEELRRALALSMREMTAPRAGNAGGSSSQAPQASQSMSQRHHQAPSSKPQPAPAPAPPTIRRRPVPRNLPLNSRVAAICMLSERVDPTTIPDDEKDCTICATTFGERNDHGESEQPIRLLGCKHLFGNGCIHRWLRANTSCPQCRREYSDELQDRTINPAIQNQQFLQAYEAALKREDVITAEAAGRAPPAEDEAEDPFFAEPSMQELQREEEMNRQLMQEHDEMSSARRVFGSPRVEAQRRPPTSHPRGRSPPRTGFGMGRPGRALSPQGPLYREDRQRERGTSPSRIASIFPQRHHLEPVPPARFGPGYPYNNPNSNIEITLPIRYDLSWSEEPPPPDFGSGGHHHGHHQGHHHGHHHGHRHPRPPPPQPQQVRYVPPGRYHSNYPGQPHMMPTIQTAHGSRVLTTEELMELGIGIMGDDPRSGALRGRRR